MVCFFVAFLFFCENLYFCKKKTLKINFSVRPRGGVRIPEVPRSFWGFPGGSPEVLGVPRRFPGGPRRFPGGSPEVPGGSPEVPGGSPEVSGFPSFCGFSNIFGTFGIGSVFFGAGGIPGFGENLAGQLF